MVLDRRVFARQIRHILCNASLDLILY